MNRKQKARLFVSATLAVFFSLFFFSPTPVYNALTAAARAESGEASNHVKLRMLSDVKQVKAGEKFRLGVELKMQDHWHTYYKEAGDAGMPTSIKWTLPAGYIHGELEWQKPHKYDDGGIVTYGYSDQAVISTTVTAPAKLSAGEQKFAAQVKYLVCKDICIPGSADLKLSLPSITDGQPEAGEADAFKGTGFTGSVSNLPLDPGSSPPNSTSTASSAATASGAGQTGSILDRTFKNSEAEDKTPLSTYLLLAVVGGFILNFMPCVLPVIAIKIISLIEQANDDPVKVRLQGLAFAAGILSSFMALGGVVIAVQSAGQKVGWGFQFQYPPFVIAMATVMTVLALSLFGLFYVNVNPGQAQIDKLANKEGLLGTFFKGVLATVLSTPCTAPALGTAVGFAFAQPGYIILEILFAVGFGMSLPYLLLTINPKWLRFIPKPGVWMEKFKESMGFLLIATVAWLLSVIAAQAGSSGAEYVGYFLTGVAFAVWIVSRFSDLNSTPKRRAIVWSIAALVVVSFFSLFILSKPELMGTAVASGVTQTEAPAGVGEISWVPFSIQELDKQVAQNKTVFLDFTAAWCLTCKVNERTVLANADVVQQLKSLNVVTMKADWTNRDPVIGQLLAKFKRSGVPLYVIFPAGKGSDPIVLPEVITPGLVIEKLKEAGPSKS
ncbi:MAG: thioredoxin family protein [Leptolyngbya sp.]|nr:thioredoxin family protein [Candidatus Melainabacteria bacterium]